MTYTECYGQIEDAFARGIGVSTVIGDVFRPDQPGLPPADAPFGMRIERQHELELTGDFGSSDVQYKGLVIKPDFARLKERFDLFGFSHRAGIPLPTYMIRQLVSWDGSRGSHDVVMTTSVTAAVMDELDETGEMLDYRLWGESPSTRVAHNRNELFYHGSVHAPDGAEHIGVLTAIARAHPELLGHANQPVRSYDTSGKFVGQTALQLGAVLADQFA